MVDSKDSSKQLLVWAAAFFITLTAIGGILTLHRWSDASRRVVELLGDVDVQASRLNALEWEAVARQALIPELRQANQSVRSKLDRTIEELNRNVNDADLQRLRGTYHSYTEAIDELFRLLEAKQFAEAIRIDSENVDPNYDALVDLIGRAQVRYTTSSRWTIMAVDVGSASVLILAAISIGLLFSRFEQIQRIKQVLITEQNALRKSEQRFRSLVHNTSDIIAILDPLPPTIRFVSDSVRRILGYRPADLIGTDILKLVHPGDTGTMQRFFARCSFSSGSTYVAEARIRRANGHWSLVEFFGDNRVEDAAIGGIVINFRDVSERKHTEEVLEHQQIEFELPERKLH